ncbi:PIN domain-containing protein [Olsenella sp. An293]|uniref:PIN domain-containing protein n=1 Tax=Olsenella sp. An293 TaxID=1965626 RepID=UPI000B39B342|nr:PIN domain-containing protein [Olsenella sp. An293]OUO32093.1 hypothetical protein B5F85_08080 [Olsenella sp. An293]
MSSSLSLLLDTNVWLDHFLPWRGGHAAAGRLMERAFEQNQTLAYAISSIKDVYYMVEAEHRRAERAETGALTESAARAASVAAWGCVNTMEEIACAVPLDHTDVWMATKQRALHGDFEDDLLIAAALRGRVDYLVTNDELLLRHCPVAALSVDDMFALLGMRQE